MSVAVQVTLYLNASDHWHNRPLHLAILEMLRQEGAYGAVALHGVAGFLGRGPLHSAHLVDVKGDLPVVVVFVDLPEHVERLLPRLREMAPGRLLVRENVQLEQEVEHL